MRDPRPRRSLGPAFRPPTPAGSPGSASSRLAGVHLHSNYRLVECRERGPPVEGCCLVPTRSSSAILGLGLSSVSGRVRGVGVCMSPLTVLCTLCLGGTDTGLRTGSVTASDAESSRLREGSSDQVRFPTLSETQIWNMSQTSSDTARFLVLRSRDNPDAPFSPVVQPPTENRTKGSHPR